MIDFKLDLTPERLAEFERKIEARRAAHEHAIETIRLAAIPHQQCRCRVLYKTPKLKDTGVLRESISYEPEPLKKGAEFGYWDIQHFAKKHYLCYIRRRCEK